MTAAWRLVFCLVAALAVAGCRDGQPAHDVLAETSDRLTDIRSGVVDLAVIVDPESGARDAFGFELHGPVALGRAGSLPTMKIAYTEIANGHRRVARIVSTGERAFVRVGDDSYALARAEVEKLEEAVRELQSSRGLGRLRIERWAKDAELSNGGVVRGAETDRVTATVDVAEAVDDLLELSRPFAAFGLADLRRNAVLLRRVARSGRIDVYTGSDDRLLRELRLHADVGLDLPGVVAGALGGFRGAEVTFELGISRPNQRVVTRMR